MGKGTGRQCARRMNHTWRRERVIEGAGDPEGAWTAMALSLQARGGCLGLRLSFWVMGLRHEARCQRASWPAAVWYGQRTRQEARD